MDGWAVPYGEGAFNATAMGFAVSGLELSSGLVETSSAALAYSHVMALDTQRGQVVFAVEGGYIDVYESGLAAFTSRKTAGVALGVVGVEAADRKNAYVWTGAPTNEIHWLDVPRSTLA